MSPTLQTPIAAVNNLTAIEAITLPSRIKSEFTDKQRTAAHSL